MEDPREVSSSRSSKDALTVDDLDAGARRGTARARRMRQLLAQQQLLRGHDEQQRGGPDDELRDLFGARARNRRRKRGTDLEPRLDRKSVV